MNWTEAAGPPLEQVAPRASIDALSDELRRGWPKVRARVPPGVAGEPATAAAGWTCSEGANMPSCTVSLRSNLGAECERGEKTTGHAG